MIIVLKQQAHESTEVAKVLLSTIEDARTMVETNIDMLVGDNIATAPDYIILLQIDAQGDPTEEGDSYDIDQKSWWSQRKKENYVDVPCPECKHTMSISKFDPRISPGGLVACTKCRTKITYATTEAEFIHKINKRVFNMDCPHCGHHMQRPKQGIFLSALTPLTCDVCGNKVTVKEAMV